MVRKGNHAGTLKREIIEQSSKLQSYHQDRKRRGINIILSRLHTVGRKMYKGKFKICLDCVHLGTLRGRISQKMSTKIIMNMTCC